MFCVKCGSEIKDTDHFCPKCGAKNENYIDNPVTAKTFKMKKTDSRKEEKPKEETKKQQEKQISENSGDITAVPDKKKGLKLILPLAAAAVVIIIGIIVIPGILKTTSVQSHVEYSKRGTSAYMDDNHTAYFFTDSGTIKLDGSAEDARTTPDYSKYVFLDTDNVLSYKTSEETEFSKISDNTFSIKAVSNKGCFYTKEETGLAYFNFESGKETAIGFDEYDTLYSAGNLSVAGVNEDGQLYLFSDGNESPESICNIGDDASILAVADDGSNIIWAEYDDNTKDIFMLKDGIPERIGVLANKEDYYYTTANFFADGKSLVVYSPFNSSILISVNGSDVEEISLPGVMGFGSLFDANGVYIDSEDDNMSEFYLSVLDNEDAEVQSIYKWTPDDGLTEIASNISCASWNRLGKFDNSSDYILTDQYIYYIDGNQDFCKKALNGKADQETEKITTNVDIAYMPKAGGYAYVVKNDIIYYIDLADKENTLNMICVNFTSDSLLYTTDAANVIYYIVDMNESEDGYWSKGTLYQYTVGEKPAKIAEDIMGLIKKDSLTYHSETPIIRQYVSNQKVNLVQNYATIEDGKYTVKIKNMD